MVGNPESTSHQDCPPQLSCFLCIIAAPETGNQNRFGNSPEAHRYHTYIFLIKCRLVLGMCRNLGQIG